MPAWLKRLSYALLQVLDYTMPILLGLVVAIGINAIEPFGIGNATKAHSQRITARMFAPFYKSQAQDQMAVVLIDDATLVARGMSWPPRYSYYEEMLRRILAHQPRAVYVDVLLEDRRDYDDSFAATVQALEATLGDAGIPVYFGVSTLGGRSIFSAAGARNVVTSWQGAGSDYPLHVSRDNEMRMAGVRPDVATEPTLGQRRSVALALYQEACPDSGFPGCREAAQALGPQEGLPAMAVRWGSTPAVLADKTMREQLHECLLPEAPRWRQRLQQSARIVGDSFASGMVSGIEDDGRETCAYTLTVFEEQLDGELLLGDAAGAGALLNDRVVLVGTHLMGANDRVLSPVHQQIPGVYLHAMALDNLMHFGSRYARPISKLGGVGLALANAVLMSLAGGWVVWFMSGWVARGVADPALPWWKGKWMQLFWLFGALFIAGVLLAGLFQVLLRLPPPDVIGLVMAAFGLGLLVHGLARRYVLPQTMEAGNGSGNVHQGTGESVAGNGSGGAAGGVAAGAGASGTDGANG